MAGGETVRVAETNRATEEGEVARPGEGGLAVRVQLRGIQPDPNPETAGAVCMSARVRIAAARICRNESPHGNIWAAFKTEMKLRGRCPFLRNRFFNNFLAIL